MKMEEDLIAADEVESKGGGLVEDSRGGRGDVLDTAQINVIEDDLDEAEFKSKVPSRGML